LKPQSNYSLPLEYCVRSKHVFFSIVYFPSFHFFDRWILHVDISLTWNLARRVTIVYTLLTLQTILLSEVDPATSGLQLTAVRQTE
jgi:hypothetical protein